MAIHDESIVAPFHPETDEPDEADDVIAAVQRLLAEPMAADVDRADLEALRSYYAEARQLMWITGTQWSPRAIAVMEEIKRAGDWGLDASQFDLPELMPEAEDEAENLSALADAEIKLSLAALKYARFARGGRIPDPAGQLSEYMDRRPQLLPAATVLSELALASAPDQYLKGLNPRQPQFEKLRRHYLALRDGGKAALPRVPEQGANLMAGDADPDVAIVRKRLGVPAGEGDAPVYDDDLVDAVQAFQRAHGLSADGIVGKRTRRALNGNGSVSLESILANMEEWRWMPDDLGDTYVWVNIPEFMVRVVKDGKVIHKAPIVVGTTQTQTPIFSKDLQKLYFRPRWYIPDSIKVNEIWPRLRRGGDSGYEILRNGKPVSRGSVNWSRADVRNYTIYQPSGSGNALGLVKFTFPNKHSVYMHDTPSKDLFGSDVRAYSHGCIRVKDPDQLAKVLLGIDQDVNPGQVDSFMHDGPDNQVFPLETHIPVHITYFTAWGDENGDIATAPDVYGHEKRIKLALQGKWDEIDRNAPEAVVLNVPPPSATRRRSAPSGFFSSASSAPAARPRGDTANDIFRNSFGN